MWQTVETKIWFYCSCTHLCTPDSPPMMLCSINQLLAVVHSGRHRDCAWKSWSAQDNSLHHHRRARCTYRGSGCCHHLHIVCILEELLLILIMCVLFTVIDRPRALIIANNKVAGNVTSFCSKLLHTTIIGSNVWLPIPRIERTMICRFSY